MTILRECPCCANPGVELRSFAFEHLNVGVVSCSCGCAVCLPAAQVQAAWNLRRNTDAMLTECLPLLKVIILLFADYKVDAEREKILLNRIVAHLSKGAGV